MKEKLNKILINFGKILLLAIACFSAISNTANAASAPSSLSISSFDKNKTAISWPTTFRVKKTSSGKYVYCTYYSKSSPKSGIKYSKGSLIKDNGMNYILNESQKAKNDSNFFIYQSALWVYMVDKGIMPGTHNEISTFKNRLNNSSSTTAKKIKKLVSAAKKASKNDTSKPTISVSTSGITFTLKDGYYVSNEIKVKNSTNNKYKVKLTSAPAGTKYTTTGNKLVIKVPSSKVTTSSDVSVKFKVSNSKTIYKSYYYKPNNSRYQIMAATYKDTLNASDSATLKIYKKQVSIPVLKVDASTGKAISGAGLQVLNSKGTSIASWTSTESAYTLKNLTKDTYTLKETSAPKGYKLSNVEVKFTVNDDGTVTSNGNKITQIKYTNETTSVTISKQDITSKAEVPGAHLVIKDANGTQIVEWTSSDKKYVIKGLAAGKYTLSETIAPAGYTRSTTTITFQLDKYGKLYNGAGQAVDYVVMYNEKTPDTPSKDVHISKSDITTSEEVPGAHLIVKNKTTGSVVDEWTSTEEEHIIKDLKEGSYTLSETIAPEGYKLSTTTIEFSIDSKGQLCDENGSAISKVVMYNEKKPTTGSASISKQDATNGKELPGATLIVKDYEGNKIDEWVSTNEPHLIENLKPGIYTLTETIAPSGYILSSETVTFTIKEDGSVTPVVMKNAPDKKETPTPTPDTPNTPNTPDTPNVPTTPNVPQNVPVESTGSFKTMTSSILGILIIAIGSLFITKNIKKTEA